MTRSAVLNVAYHRGYLLIKLGYIKGWGFQGWRRQGLAADLMRRAVGEPVLLSTC